MSAEQDLLLNAIDNPATARILAEIWKQIEGEPLMAARMIRSFQSAGAIITETLRDLPAKWKQLEDALTEADLHRARFTQDLMDFRKNIAGELAAATTDLKALQEFALKIDEDRFINRLNRLLDICERLRKAKQDGTLDILKHI